MKFVWQEEKNKLLQKERNISFEQVVLAIGDEQVVDILEHPKQEKYKGQKLLMVNIDNYIYVVPVYISDSGEECNMITIYPSRKYTAQYLGGKK